MTRLTEDMVRDLPSSLEALDRELLRSTGAALLGLASRTVPCPPGAVAATLFRTTAAVAPLTAGRGVITGFAEAVAATLSFIGMESFVTRKTDAAGAAEAFGRGADLLFMADDDAFVSLNLHTRSVTDNAAATAAGFVQALAARAESEGGGLGGRNVLVLGLGPVGRCAVHELRLQGAHVWVYDSNAEKTHAFCRRYDRIRQGVSIAPDPARAMEEIDYVIDATPAPDIITEAMLRADTVISCPGVPHGLTPAALEKVGTRFIHDTLALGVAVMAVRSRVGLRGLHSGAGVGGSAKGRRMRGRGHEPAKTHLIRSRG